MIKIIIALFILTAILIIYLRANPASIVIGFNIISNIKNKVTRKIVTIGDDQWIYNSSGDGEKLVLLHGFGASKESWNKILPYLNKNYSIIAVDIPGYGESSKNMSSNYSINDQVVRLNAFITSLELESFHIAGNSMGGAIAGAYAAKYPSKVKILWLIAPAGIKSAKKSDFDNLYEKTGENIMIANTVEEFEQQMTWLYDSPPNLPEYIKQGIVELTGNETKFIEKLHTDLLINWTPLEETLIGFKGRVLITWGKNDRLTDVSGAAILHQVLPQSKFYLMPNTGHVPMLEHPKKTAAQFIDFK